MHVDRGLAESYNRIIKLRVTASALLFYCTGEKFSRPMVYKITASRGLNATSDPVAYLEFPWDVDIWSSHGGQSE